MRRLHRGWPGLRVLAACSESLSAISIQADSHSDRIQYKYSMPYLEPAPARTAQLEVLTVLESVLQALHTCVQLQRLLPLLNRLAVRPCCHPSECQDHPAAQITQLRFGHDCPVRVRVSSLTHLFSQFSRLLLFKLNFQLLHFFCFRWSRAFSRLRLLASRLGLLPDGCRSFGRLTGLRI